MNADLKHFRNNSAWGMNSMSNVVSDFFTKAKTDPPFMGLSLAVLVPSYNEEAAIATVVKDFKDHLPTADIYVYDNNSTDDTVTEARAAGAIVRSEPRQGKGHVVRRMFSDVDADIYIMVDGDDTYDASAAPDMVNRMIEEGLDLVNGMRVAENTSAYRPGHKFGNKMLSGIVQTIFGRGTTDMLSGYRVFSNRFVKTFPMMSRGFEVETELTVHALELQMPIGEVPGKFKDRAEGSESKLNSIRDGVRILKTIARLWSQERPFAVLGSAAAVFALMSLVLAAPVFLEYFQTGLVPRLPTAVLSATMMSSAFLLALVGRILDLITKGRQESKRMQYLAVPGVLSKAQARRRAQDDD